MADQQALHTEEEELPSALRKGPAHGKRGWLGNSLASGRGAQLMHQPLPREHRPLHTYGFCSANCHLYRLVCPCKGLNLNLNLISKQCQRRLCANSTYSQKGVSHALRNTITRRRNSHTSFKTKTALATVQ